MSKTISYKDAGVDIDAGNESVRRIKDMVKTTFGAGVVTGLGTFGAMFDLSQIAKDYKEPVLVQSVDGVGTKLKVAQLMQKYDTVGRDIVAHCCDDILVQGAKPLTFLDYVATAKLSPDIFEQIIKGMVDECCEAGVSLIGGETAEMPGVYLPGEHDIAGCIMGIVEKSQIIDGRNIKPGDKLIGLPSSGLHTNGYSLARKVLLEVGGFKVTDQPAGLNVTVGEALLAPHINYTKYILSVLDQIKGMAHITGGGFVENIPRTLPTGVDVQIKKGSWPVLPIFDLIQQTGNVIESEMYHVFNMGIGLVLIVDKETKLEFRDINSYELGEVVKGSGKVNII
ncbi:MAG: phosphoribosylformylglycinamidine cyclo-ligase [Patescibacteria group bacterium]